MLRSSSTKLSYSLTFFLALALAALTLSGKSEARTTISSDDPYTLRNLAFQCYLEGQTDSALEMYQKAVDRATSEYGDNSTYVADLYYELGCLAFDAGKERTAESCLQDALKRNPNAEMARIKLAEILQVRARPDEALMQIRQALAKNKTSVPARRALVLWLEERGFKALATQESFTLSQIARGRDHRIAPPRTPDIRVATVQPPPKVTKPEAKPQEAKPSEVATAKITPPAFFKKFLKQASEVVTPKPEKQPAPPKVAKVRAPEPKPVRVKPQPQPPPVKTAVEPPKPQVEAPAPPPPPIKTASAPAKPSKRSNGLVPPPPPMTPTFPPVFMPPPGYQPGFVLRTDAKIKNAQKTKEPAKEAPKESTKEQPKEPAAETQKEPAAQNEDGDPEFILDWASVKGQKKKK